MMDTTIDPEDEVKKLQNLVKKLEKQNELLRSKADAIGTVSANGTLPLTESNTNLNSNGNIKSGKSGDTRTKNSNKNLLDSVKVLDVHPEEDDDDSWLYTSPIKVATPEQKSVSPYDWVRQDFEHPNREMESAKKCLLAKLDEVSRANRNSVGPGLPFLQQPQVPNLANIEIPRGIEKLDSSPPSLSPPPVQRKERRQSHEERLGGMAKLEDVTDVQILARMQEESLRQATQISPANSPRRVQMSPASSENMLHRPASRSSSVSSTEGRSEDSEEGGKSNVVRRRPSFERIRKAGEGGRRDGMYRNNMDYRPDELDELEFFRPVIGRRLSQEKIRRPSGEGNERREVSPRNAPEPRNGEAKPSPVSRVRGSEAEKQTVHRGSMPNLNRTYIVQPPAPAPTPCTPPQTPSTNDNHLQDASMGLENNTKLKQPSTIPVNRAPSPRTLKQPSPTKLRGASPHRSSGIPVRASQVEKSQIPRPRSAIINAPRSGIPSPGSRGSAVSPRGSVKTKDDSWREGCY